MNAWIETYTGIHIDPLAPRPEDIRSEDIAHALSNLCRYNGHCKHFFSVAQHSINAAKYALRHHDYRIALLALLHDAAEAYVSDIATPIKPHVRGFSGMERRVQKVIYSALFVCPPDAEEARKVKHIDNVMMVTEAAALMPFNGWGEWTKEYKADEETDICYKEQGVVKKDFLDIYFVVKNKAKRRRGYAYVPPAL